MALDIMRLGEYIQKLFRLHVGVRPLRQVVKKNDKLVAAKPCHGVRFTKFASETVGDFAQEGIAHSVPQTVIDSPAYKRLCR